MNEEAKKLLDEAKQTMNGAVVHLQKELVKLRAGKASPQMLEGVKVDYYGTPTPIENIANISTPDPKQIVIQPWEKSMLTAIDKAILAANLGFTPKIDADVVRITLPPITEERRKDLVKRSKTEAEDAKIAIRNVRRNILEKVKKLKDKGVSEDEIKQAEKELQDLTDKNVKETDAVIALKEKEIMSI
ncbi:MAG: ribosome recycling factor [Bacteroidales bacterium]|jgi:ribosome recycling factor|nr:ribosome recycling factor [Bacteroidales bacterium]